MSARTQSGIVGIQRFLDLVFEGDIHAMRILWLLSIANATLGVLSSASLAVYAIGQGLDHARGLISKHAIKQVNRLLSNSDFEQPHGN